MWVTSASEVLLPRALDLIFVLPDQIGDDPEIGRRQAVILRQLDLRFQPEFCFSVSTVDVDMRSRFLPGEEEETKPSLSENSWAHEGMLADVNKGGLTCRPPHILIREAAQRFSGSLVSVLTESTHLSKSDSARVFSHP